MPTVLRKDGFDFMIYTLDHEPSHTHVWKAGKELVINLGNENQRPYIRDNNGMSNRNKKKALKIAAYTEAELDKMFKEADKRGKERLKTEPRAKGATYDPKTRRVIIEMMNGCVFIVPVDLMQGLWGASDEDLIDFSLMPRGFDLHWHKLDAQFTVFGLLQGLFGTKRWMAELGRMGGRVTSEAKRAAARINGRLGGRPLAVAAAKATKKRRSAA